MDTRKTEAALAKKYGYKKLPEDLSVKYRNWFLENTKDYLKSNQPLSLYTHNGTLLCSSYDRIVVGDYGAFVEFNEHQANQNSFVVAPGQEYRINDPKYSKNVKYEWYTIQDGSGVKIYKQKRGVTYADYIPGKFYVSVHEVQSYSREPHYELEKCPLDDGPDLNGEENCQECPFAKFGEQCGHPDAVYIDINNL